MGTRRIDFVANKVLLLLSERAKWEAVDLVYWATDAEAIILFSEVVACNPEVILECGTANGWTAAWMDLALEQLQSHTIIHTFDIEPRAHISDSTRIIYSDTPFHKGVVPIMEDVGELRKLVFIDGNHVQAQVYKDYEVIVPYLKKDDVVIIHDTIGELGCYNTNKKLCRYGTYAYCRHYGTRNGMSSYKI